MKDAAVVGAAAAVGGGNVSEPAAAEAAPAVPAEEERCPYFDQPLYCKGMSKTGKHLCEE